MSLSIQPVFFGMTVPRQTMTTQPREDMKGSQIPFAYSNELKTLFKKGLLPTVKVDAAGNKLTKKNVTLDHIIPRGKGGKSETGNYMLAEKKFNNNRGADPINQWITMDGLVTYLNQFIGVRVRHFVGNDYITNVLQTLEKANALGV